MTIVNAALAKMPPPLLLLLVLLSTSRLISVSGVPAPEKIPAPNPPPLVSEPLNTRRLEMVTPAAMFAPTLMTRCAPSAWRMVLLEPAPTN